MASLTVSGVAQRSDGCPRRAHMIGQGEGLELLAVFVTIMGSLALLVVFGRWWEA